MLKKYIFSILILILALFTISTVTRAATYPSGSLLKPSNSSTVYYIGEDSKKYAFPDSKTYATWYDNFDDVITVNISTLDSYPDGGVMPYRAGTKLITHQNTSKIYAVEPNGIIRWLPTEAVAKTLYGDAWYLRVQDVIPGYFSTSYSLGSELSDTLPSGTIIREKNTNNYYYIENGQKRISTEYNNYHSEDIVEVDDVSNYSDEDSNDTSTPTPEPTPEPEPTPSPTPTPEPTPYCGDNSCSNGETCSSCATDCGLCPVVDNDLDNDGYDSVASGGNDCNDSNSSIHPGATDICGDSIDQDCSGSDLTCPVPGNPTIDSVSGSLLDGQNLVISGSGFGSQGPNVILFDNFEGGINGQQIQLNSATVGVWSHLQAAGTAPGVYYSNSSAVSGSLAFRANDDNGPNNISKLFPATTEVFATWWIRHEGFNWPGQPSIINWKTVWLMETEGGSADGTDITLPSTVSGTSWYTHGNRIPSNMVTYGVFGSWGHNIWRRVAYHVKFEQSTGIGDAQFWTVASGDIPWRKTIDIQNAPVALAGHTYKMIVVNGYGYDSPNNYPMFDDFYLATGPGAQARVEISDSPVYEDSTNLSIFTPNSWSDSEIKASINKGSFGSGVTLYLYVIDKEGNISNAYPLEFAT